MKVPSPSSATFLLAGALVALAIHTPLGAQGLRYSGSLGFSSGSYIFADRTESLALLNGLTFSRGRVSLSATLPVISQNSGDVAFLGGGMMPTGGSDRLGATVGHAGMGMGGSGGTETPDSPEVMHGSFQTTIGDPIFRGSLLLLHGFGHLRSVSAEAMVKAPLASVSSGVGTGAWDFGVGASSVMALGRNLILLRASFWSPGDYPDLVLKEYIDFSIGAGRLLGQRWSVLSSLNLATTVIDTIGAPASASLSFGFRPNRGRNLNGGLSIGLSEASPDLSVFIGWSLGLFGSEGLSSM